MALKELLQRDLTAATKARDRLRLSVVRMLLAAIKNREIELRRALTEGELLETVSRLIKQRHESASQFRQGGRADLAEKEEAEAALLAGYLPQPLTPEALAAKVDEAIARAGAASPADMGKVMKLLLPEIAGRADSKTAAELVRARLAARGG
ncbi:MAG TPA: GatB/YqeY domain-containing protein [Thermodesulfobacteriota bacterium]|nr:GatB/YqeY domain-containing protein [Thermodesulfobacteriota bacterium]